MMTAIAITMNCNSMPSRCCQSRTDSPKDAPSDSTTVPTMTPAATRLRVMSSMMMKIIVNAATPAIIKYDLMIAGVAALTMIFIIMLLITRSLVAAGVIVGTVVLSLGASFGLSVLLWQHLLGMELQFMVMAMAVIILLAVGADYNLLLVARMKEEIPAGINTGIIR